MDTRLVYGFLDAGKTTWIQDCIFHDYFHKYGTTLVLTFESGETEYDAEALSGFKTHVACWESSEDIAAFTQRQLETYAPDRVYVELNGMREGLRGQLPRTLQITAATALIDFRTLPSYLTNLRKQLYEMIRDSRTVIFRNCASKEQLAPYGQAFRLMNQRAVYLRQDPMGYHERAFDRFVPYDLTGSTVQISESAYLPFFLDACEHPEHYQGKTLCFDLPLEIRDGIAGITVMTCCMADLTFMGFPAENSPITKGWVSLTAAGIAEPDVSGQKLLRLRPIRIAASSPPENLVLNAV